MKMTTTTEKDESNLLKLQAHPPTFHPQVLKVQHVRVLVKNIQKISREFEEKTVLI